MIEGEANLSQRIKREREARRWSPAMLAERLTDAGCPIQTSAIYRIEREQRTISVNELVALADVFDRDPQDLLRPIDLVDKERADHLVAEVLDSLEVIRSHAGRLMETMRQVCEAGGAGGENGDEIYKYVMGQVMSAVGRARTASDPFRPGEDGDKDAALLDRIVSEAQANLILAGSAAAIAAHVDVERAINLGLTQQEKRELVTRMLTDGQY